MVESYNILRIDGIEGMDDNAFDGDPGACMTFRTALNYSIRMNCPEIGMEFMRLEFTTEGVSHDHEESFKEAVQHMLDGRHSGVRQHIYPVNHKCKVVKKVHKLDVRYLPEELQDLFRQLFDPSKWEFELKTLN